MKTLLITFPFLFFTFSLFSQEKVALLLQGDAKYYNYDPTTFEIYENGVKIGDFDKTWHFRFTNDNQHVFVLKHPDFVELTLQNRTLSKTDPNVIVSPQISESTLNRLSVKFQEEQFATCTTSVKAELNSKYENTLLDTVAEFPGGRAALSQYLGENLRYPEYCIDNNIQGKVYVSFIVEENGHITCIKIEKSAHYFLDKEAFRCVKNFPKFEPAKLNGKPIATIYKFPVNFRMN
nr:energy transducer TonB [uncultured Fluviicola sp.]